MAMTGHTMPESVELLCGLEERPAFLDALIVALQHVLAMFVGIITPPVILGEALKLPAEDTAYLVSTALLVSGIGTILQTRRIGPVGSGLLSVQGTSFAFIPPILAAAGTVMAAGGGVREALGVAFGVSAATAPLIIILSRCVHRVRRLFTPIVTGTVVALIGLTLLQVAATNVGGGLEAKADGSFGSVKNLGLAAIVVVTILVFSCCGSRQLRMLSVIIGLLVGDLIGIAMGGVDFSNMRSVPALAIPMPFRFGLGLRPEAVVPFAFTYVVSSVEAVGDLTATAALSGQTVSGPAFTERLRGGLLADGISSMLGACLGCSPTTTFAQNNGVIQLTGVGSSYVGRFIGGLLVLMGLVPAVGVLVQAMPRAALGGATLIMFGLVAAAGVRILSGAPVSRRTAIIIAVSLGAGLGVSFVPELLSQLPALLRNTLSSGIATGGLCALILDNVVPHAHDIPNNRLGERNNE